MLKNYGNDFKALGEYCYMVGTVICCICGINKTANPDAICDDCKLSILYDKDIPPDLDDIF